MIERHVPIAGTQIRGTHPYCYRSGEWATLWGIVHREDRDCYIVRFPDGETDEWVVNDPMEPYEFRPPKETHG